MIIILSTLNRFKKFFSLEDSLVNLQLNGCQKSYRTLHMLLQCTLPCETITSAKQAINDKLQGSVAIYLRCGGVVNNQIKKRFTAESVSEKNFKIGEHMAKLQTRM